MDLTVGWMRSVVVDDIIELHFEYDIGNWSLVGLGTENQSLVLYGFHKETDPELEPDLTEVSRASSGSEISDTEPSPKEAKTAGAPSNSVVSAAQLDPKSSQESEPADALSASFESESVNGWSGTISSQQTFISCTFPSPLPLVTISFSFVAIPLTLLSACLILWKPRKRKVESDA